MYIEFGFGRKKQPEEVRRTTIENPGVPVNASNILEVFNSTGDTASGISVTEESAVGFSAVHSCVRILSSTIASLPLNVFRYEGKGKQIDPSHPIYHLLHDEPSEMYTSYNWRELMEASLDLWGNAYSKIIRDKKYNVQWLDFVHPSLVEPYQIIRADGTKALRYKIQRTGEDIPQSDMLHISGLGFDGIKGKSPIEIAQENIGLGLAAEQFGAKFFANGASFNGVLESDQNLKKEQIDVIRATWQERHGGSGNSWKTPVLPFGLKYSPIGIPPEAAQYIATRKFQLEEVARIFGVPPHMIGDLDKSSFSNIEQQSIDFVVNTMRPRCVRWEMELNRKLLREDEKGTVYTKFNLDGLLRGDSSARSAYLNTMVSLGIYTRNEAREYEDKNPIDGLDEPLTPANLMNQQAKDVKNGI
jgi:HK97 family phage portal protein